MNYKFESKRDQVYFTNYTSLKKAIEDAAGDGDRLIADYEGLLDILARNEIMLNPQYTGKRGAVDTADIYLRHVENILEKGKLV